MAKWIDADRFKADLRAWALDPGATEGMNPHASSAVLSTVLDVIELIDIAAGEALAWIEERGGCECPRCGHMQDAPTNYCPDCGARMA